MNDRVSRRDNLKSNNTSDGMERWHIIWFPIVTIYFWSVQILLDLANAINEYILSNDFQIEFVELLQFSVSVEIRSKKSIW